jgi:phage baseplate assembly protein W
MPGFSPKLPLVTDQEDGYALTKNLKEVAKQNFKMLVLTNPGERIMDPTFGVGILAYLFENNTPSVYQQIESRIRQQAEKYLPYITVENIQFNSPIDNPGLADNFLGVSISYSIQRLGVRDTLQISTN